MAGICVRTVRHSDFSVVEIHSTSGVKLEAVRSFIHCYPFTSPHGITTQKTTTDIFTAVRTSNLIQIIADSLNFYILVRFKIFKVVTILTMFFWVKSPCEVVGRSQRFGEVC
jgi:hypothetical protein